jgi:zinc protease
VQTDLVMGTLAVERKSPDYLPAILGNSVLGQFGMMGRIGEVVRERSGLAYYASSSVSGGTLPGTWDVQAGVNPSNLEKAIDLIKKEISLFVKEGVTEEELNDSQEAFIGRLPLSLESNSGVAKALVSIERKNLGLDYYYSYESRIRSVTPEMVVETARKYLGPGNFAIATCGPALSANPSLDSPTLSKDETA